MIETYRTIVLHDGGRIDLPLQKGQQVWAVTIAIAAVDQVTGTHSGCSPAGVVHVTRETLESAVLVGKKPDPPKPTEPDSPEDLVLQLLEHVGVYPTEQ